MSDVGRKADPTNDDRKQILWSRYTCEVDIRAVQEQDMIKYNTHKPQRKVKILDNNLV